MNPFKPLKTALLVLVAGLAASLANAQTDSTSLGAFTNLPATIAAGSGSNQTSIIDVWQNRGLALQGVFNASAGTSNAAVLLYPSADGTNFASAPWVWITPLNGANNVIGFTNFAPAQLVGVRRLNLGSMTNQNAGILTNKGVLFSRPY